MDDPLQLATNHFMQQLKDDLIKEVGEPVQISLDVRIGTTPNNHNRLKAYQPKLEKLLKGAERVK